jgi:hypothetical protein
MTVELNSEFIHGKHNIELVNYAKGGICILLIDASDGSPAATATVCIPEATPPSGHVWLKGWSENEGLPEALAAAGVVELLPRVYRCGYAYAKLARVIKLAEMCAHVSCGSDNLCHTCGSHIPETSEEKANVDTEH